MAAKSLDNQIEQYLPLLSKEKKQLVLNAMESFFKLKDDLQSNKINTEQYNKKNAELKSFLASSEVYTQQDLAEMMNKW